MNIKIDYFAIFNIESSPGLKNKIIQTVAAFNTCGYIANKIIIPWTGYNNKFEFIKRIFLSKADILLIRSNTLLPLLFFTLIWKRIQGKKIIIDIPTPNTVVLHELKILESKKIKYILRMCLRIAIFPWALYPANRILQYAHESFYFSFGIRKKIALVSNGINVKSIPACNLLPKWPVNTFVMIAVAAMAEWHGFDRVIKGISKYRVANFENINVNVRLIIVGDGDCRSSWEKLSNELNCGSCVEFVGFQTGSSLSSFFDQSHVAISSLGLFRKGLDMASDLKSREYTARGLPFIAAGADIDFDPPPFFLFKANNTDEPIDIAEVIAWYSNISKNRKLNAEIRQYAVDRLDFSKKVPELLKRNT